MFRQSLFTYVVRAMVLLTAIPIHECAHAWASWKQGDPTAKNMGRLTLNPLPHLDLIGSVLMLFTGFGWAKPVPVSTRYYKNVKKGMILTALAGNTFLNSELCGYYIANTLLMLVVSLSLSYLIGMFIPNSNILSGVANIVSLSMCFLCGVFVPMDVMDKSVLKVAQFLPVYWYEQVNEILSRHHSLTPELLGKVRISMGIEVLFAATFVCLILVVSRYRKEG